jgi:hypothetical protein
LENPDTTNNYPSFTISKMTSGDVIVGTVLMAAGVICVFVANYQYWELRSEINEGLPHDEQFDPMFWTPFGWAKFYELRKRIIPDSPRPKRAIKFAVVGFCCFFSGVAFLLVKATS